MARCQAMNWRSAASFLLVCCLAISTISPFASQTYPAKNGDAQGPLGIAAPDATAVCVFATKVENHAGPDSQPAIVSLPNGLQLFARVGGLLRCSNDRTPPTSLASATDIRGPPPAA